MCTTNVSMTQKVHHLQHVHVYTFLLQGNNHVFEYNEVDHVCLETPSCSAFLTTEDWTFVSRPITLQNQPIFLFLGYSTACLPFYVMYSVFIIFVIDSHCFNV